MMHSSMKATPFSLLLNFDPFIGLIENKKEEQKTSIQEKRAEAQAQLELAQQQYKKYYDKSTIDISFSNGDWVWLETTYLPIDRPSRKLEYQRVGPFEVTEKVGEVSYRLKLPVT